MSWFASAGKTVSWCLQGDFQENSLDRSTKIVDLRSLCQSIMIIGNYQQKQSHESSDLRSSGWASNKVKVIETPRQSKISSKERSNALDEFGRQTFTSISNSKISFTIVNENLLKKIRGRISASLKLWNTDFWFVCKRNGDLRSKISTVSCSTTISVFCCLPFFLDENFNSSKRKKLMSSYIFSFRSFL